MGAKPPHGEFTNIKINTFKVKQHVGVTVVLKQRCPFKPAAIAQDSGIREHFVDPFQPFLRIAATALQDQPFSVAHFAKITGLNSPDGVIAHGWPPSAAAAWSAPSLDTVQCRIP